MNSKNEVFEYLIDQLRQQLPAVDVMGEIKRWSIDRSIVGRGIYTDEENAVIDAYIGMTNNPYKQQCEDLAHEVQSLKNQLRDASALVAELQGDNIKKSEHISHLTGRVKELHLALVQATGDVEAYKLIRKGGYGSEQSGCRDAAAQVEKSWIEHTGAACPVLDDTVVDIKFRNGEVESNTKALWWSWRTNGGPYEIVGYRVVKQGHGPEQSGCRKEDTQEWPYRFYYVVTDGSEQSGCHKVDVQECSHNWRFVNGKAPAVCINCGVTKSSECEHEWQFYGVGFPCMCKKCGLKK